MTARIYRPTKTAMQSGRAKTRDWILEFEPTRAQRADPLMGWAGAGDTATQVRLRFASGQDAVDFARRRGIEAVVDRPASATLTPKSYADNFRYDRPR
jgi:hypothetical protein